MKFAALSILLALSPAIGACAETGPPTDADILHGMFTEAVGALLRPVQQPVRKTVSIFYSQQCRPGIKTRESVEALLTELGWSIIDTVSDAGLRADIVITDTRVVLERTSGNFTRTISLAVHVVCRDSSGRVIAADTVSDTRRDVLSSRQRDATNNGEQFCGGVKRYVVEKKISALQLYSFIALTSLLVFFAFQ